MGTFYTSCRVENHDRKRRAEIRRLLVDTGSEYTWIGSKLLESLGIRREKKDQSFVMANGQQVSRCVGFAVLHVSNAFTTDEVVFAEKDDLQLLGARTLEGLNLRVDSRAKKLVAAGPILAA
jgi:predicted aspartyl protease